MNDVKHTPGTWYWDDEVWTDYDPAERAPWLIGADGRLILTGQIRCQTKADADLISAAPELLEALQWMSNLWQCTCAMNGWDPEHAREYQRAKDVLAKAEGKS
jgi:hypothetical protein